MAAKLARLTIKIAIRLHLVQRAVWFAVFAPGGQSGKYWICPRICPTFSAVVQAMNNIGKLIFYQITSSEKTW